MPRVDLPAKVNECDHRKHVWDPTSAQHQQDRKGGPFWESLMAEAAKGWNVLGWRSEKYIKEKE